MIIKLDGKKVSYAELFGAFLTKVKNKNLL